MSSKTGQRRPHRGEYIETDTGNKISRKAKIEGTPHITLAGRVVVQADVCLRGDLVQSATNTNESKETPRTSIAVGRYTMISSGAIIHPPHRIIKGEAVYYPMKIGENVFIGPRAVVSAASIGSHVHLDAGCVIGNGCIIRDGVKVLEGSVLAAGMVVPSGVVVGGAPARILGDLPDGWGADQQSLGEGEWVEGGDLRELIRSVK